MANDFNFRVRTVMECEWAGANTKVKVNRSSGPPVLCVLVLETRLVWGLIDRDIRVGSSTEWMGDGRPRPGRKGERDAAMAMGGAGGGGGDGDDGDELIIIACSGR